MGRKGGELTEVGSSSIALLQERFRKLEKMREKRQERELLRLFSGPEKTITQPKEILHSRPTLQDSLSLGLDSYSRHAEYQSTKGPTLTDFWSKSRVHDSPEVDTSLHL